MLLNSVRTVSARLVSAAILGVILLAIFLVGFFWWFLADSPTPPQKVLDFPSPTSDSSYRTHPPELVSLGRLLFYDRVLSGTYRVSCATCHHPDRATSNGFLLDNRTSRPTDSLAVAHLPHYGAHISSSHSPTLYNLGAHEFTTLFTDGRLRIDSDSDNGTYIAPSSDLPVGLSDILAVQALFPAVSRDELLGHLASSSSSISSDNRILWDELSERVRRLDSYAPHFALAYPNLSFPSDITIVEIANALSAFVGYEWRSDSSPFDRFLGGDSSALTEQQRRGLGVFFESGCSTCHSGIFFTDHNFHNFSFPPFGYSSVLDSADTTIYDSRSGLRDVTGSDSDLFAFRTPSLRNIAETGPYGHSGSHRNLRDAIIYHLDPASGIDSFLASRFGSGLTSENESRLVEFLASQTLTLPPLTSSEIDDIVSFLGSLTDDIGLEGRLGKPAEVPSFLVID